MDTRAQGTVEAAEATAAASTSAATSDPASTASGTRPSIAAGADPDGRPLPPLRQRLAPAMPADHLLGWLAPIGVALFAGLIRLIGLGRPASFVFDEVYYPKDAFSLLSFGVERSFIEGADERILAGDFAVFGGPSFVVHPPAGKWQIALGEAIFGMNPFGWRIAVAVLGALSVLVLARVARRLTRSTLLGCVAGALLALDGLHFVESRVALIDLPMMFWLLLGFACLLIDRDRLRDRLVDAVGPNGRITARWGPPELWRPLRLAAGLCFGIACATKWSALFGLAAFGLITWLWDMGARRAVGVRLTTAFTAGRAALDAAVAFVAVVGTAAVTYVVSWAGWFASSDGYYRNWAADSAASGLRGLIPDALRSLWHYHGEIMRFHTGLTEDHPYESNAWGWLVLARPVAFKWTDNIGPDAGCPTDRCVQQILGLGTPVLWWAGVLALVAALAFWVLGRDWRFGVPIVGVVGTWVPWLFYSDRPIFYFYAVAILPWVVLALTLVIGKIIGPSDASPQRRMWGAAIAGSFVLLVLLNFAYLYPVLTDQVIPYSDWVQRMWLRTWA